MESRQRIFLYGNSVILASLRVSLRSCPQYETITLIPPLPEAPELAALKPDMFFFDLEVTRPEAVFSLLGTCPGLVLVGVSPDRNLVKIWWGQQLQELSTQGLLEAIRERLKSPALDPNAFNSPIIPRHLNQFSENEIKIDHQYNGGKHEGCNGYNPQKTRQNTLETGLPNNSHHYFTFLSYTRGCACGGISRRPKPNYMRFRPL
jgi:hypothetical protein